LKLAAFWIISAPRNRRARTQGILPAPESAHAIRAAVNDALLARERAGAG
jgi:predicted alternative tryptophan synthase beta-subunit